MVSRGSFHPLLTTIYSIIYQLSRVLSGHEVCPLCHIQFSGNPIRAHFSKVCSVQGLTTSCQWHVDLLTILSHILLSAVY